jgi:hypothetical protein
VADLKVARLGVADAEAATGEAVEGGVSRADRGAVVVDHR